MAHAIQDLSADRANAEAWKLFQETVNRFTVEVHAVGPVLDRLTADLTPSDYRDLVMRFQIIFDALYPPKTPED